MSKKMTEGAEEGGITKINKEGRLDWGDKVGRKIYRDDERFDLATGRWWIEYCVRPLSPQQQ